MPVEIRELVIRATISQDDKGGNSQQPSQGMEDNDVPSNEQLLNMCVEKVLEILKEKHGR